MQTSLCGRTVAVLGLGVSNLPLLDLLLTEGAVITARDRKSKEHIPRYEEYKARGVRFVCGEAYLSDLDEEILFRSPGIRADTPELVRAVACGATLTSEVALFLSRTPATVIGVTGSDGKTTTTTLIAELLRAAGHRVHVGGNIGVSLLPSLAAMQAGDFAVMELSSFQTQTLQISPHIAVMTNLSPNHLDYHKDYEEYVDAKAHIFLHPPCTRVVLNAQNADVRALAAVIPADRKITWFGDDGDVAIRGDRVEVNGCPVLSTAEIRLPGRHNVENYLAAIGAVWEYITPDAIRHVATEFAGVPHRLQVVAQRDGITYINSSIDSTPTRTSAALQALSDYKGRIVLILGGYDKHIPFEPLAAPVCAFAKRVVLTGATAMQIHAAITASEAYAAHAVPLTVVPQFDKAVRRAAAYAQAGDVVLLSPACASFDAFSDFAARGARFVSLVGGK